MLIRWAETCRRSSWVVTAMFGARRRNSRSSTQRPHKSRRFPRDKSTGWEASSHVLLVEDVLVVDDGRLTVMAKASPSSTRLDTLRRRNSARRESIFGLFRCSHSEYSTSFLQSERQQVRPADPHRVRGHESHSSIFLVMAIKNGEVQDPKDRVGRWGRNQLRALCLCDVSLSIVL
jgi:hypothetical protein